MLFPPWLKKDFHSQEKAISFPGKIMEKNAIEK